MINRNFSTRKKKQNISVELQDQQQFSTNYPTTAEQVVYSAKSTHQTRTGSSEEDTVFLMDLMCGNRTKTKDHYILDLYFKYSFKDD